MNSFAFDVNTVINICRENDVSMEVSSAPK